MLPRVARKETNRHDPILLPRRVRPDSARARSAGRARQSAVHHGDLAVLSAALPITAPHHAVLGNLYWAKPYWANQAAPGVTIYSPGSPNPPPQFTGPAANPYPMGTQTCVAPDDTCPATTPSTPGLPCTCPINQTGETVVGTVH